MTQLGDTPFTTDIATTSDLAGLIPKSLIDAAGDLIVGSAADTAARLAKGADGKILGVVSGALAWVDNTGTPGATGPPGTGGSVIEAQLDANVSAAATTIVLDRTAPIAFAIGTYVIIDPFTVECEIRRITGVSGATLTLQSGLTFGHAADDIVFAFCGGTLPWNWWGGIPASTAAATTNVTAFNNLTAQVYLLGPYHYSGVFVPSGVWYVDDELKLERDQIIEGVNVMNSKIVAHTTFSFPDTETAVLHMSRDGVPVTFETGGVSGRWIIRNIYIDGNNIAGSNGLLSSPQQPDTWENLRIDNCKGYGAAMCDIQQHIIKNFEGINNGITLRIRDAGFVWIDGFNSEGADVNDVLMDCTTGGGLHQIHFENVHTESLGGDVHFKVDPTGAVSDITGLCWDHIGISSDTGKTMFEFANAAIPSGYELRSVRASGPLSSVIGVVDANRSLSLNVFDQFNGYIQNFQSWNGSYSSTANPHGHHMLRYAGALGEDVRVGVPKGGGANPTAAFWSNQVNGNDRHARFYNSGTLAFEVTTAGAVMIGAGSSYIQGALVGSTTWDPGSIADGAIATKDVTVTGAAQNMPCFATYTSLTGNWMISAICTSTNTITVTILNKTGGAVDLGNGTVRAAQVKF